MCWSRSRRALLLVGVVIACTTYALSSPHAQTPTGGSSPVVYVAEVDDVIHPISAEFMTGVLDRADTSGAAAVIFVLRTPGGLVDSTRTVVSRMIAARTPVVVFVGPSGARAASAGFLLTLAADVAVMAPGTHIGAAHPVTVSGEGQQQTRDRTMETKAASDVAAYARSLAEARRRNVTLANEAVLQSRAFTEREALQATPPLIDFIATSVDDVVRQLDGRKITRFNGTAVTLETTGARIEQTAMTWRQRFLSAIAHPQIAYLLFSLGLLGLTVELWNPGSIFPGVVGGLCLLLAFLAFQVLPIDVTGLLLIILGLGLLVLELKFPSFGVLGIGGGVSLVLGSIVMMGSDPGLRVGLRLIIPVMVALAAIFLFLGRLALASQRRRPVTGDDGMLRARGRAITTFDPGERGQVDVRGEIWSAVSPSSISAGDPVEVTGLDGLTLRVARVDDAPPGGAA